MTGCGSAWLERLVWDQEVAGSNPVTPILTNMREWLSWWSATLPRSRPRVRVPSRAFIFLKLEFQASFFYAYTQKEYYISSCFSKAMQIYKYSSYYSYSLFPDMVCSTILFIVSSFNCPLAYPNTSPSLVIINVVGNAFTP